MKVFISWSGDKSKAVAAALHEWLPGILNNVDPWMSDLDIESGQDWNQRITGELADTRFGIICITPENHDRPWLNYEAGALSRQVGAVDTRVAPLLIDFDSPTDLTGPLTKFHARLANEEGIRRLVQDLNSELLPHGVREDILGRSFQALWPQLEAQLADIDRELSQPRASRRPEREVIDEVLALVRGIHAVVGVEPESRQPSVVNRPTNDVMAAAGNAMKVIEFDGRYLLGYDGVRLMVTTDVTLLGFQQSVIRKAVQRSDSPKTPVVFSVDADEIRQFEEEYEQQREY
ncbi:toll/interleukin-1 receptor domain-containing protein [Arthrobacter sp. SX1312]|uniref:toll/interleukin-1 receptor domain-containing protein n=1 Tax=Arthrobacter sp. SX1312 TaxID=2058896 RepID=UPI000CE44A97|nr:toll/interleukin-1 receptor domain-containing protein [Arthrobacter sp. SX1312]